jgi:hypothetical protein
MESVISPMAITGESRLRSPTVSSTWAIAHVLKPLAFTVTEYWPIGKAKRLKLPWPSVTACLAIPVPKWVAMTSAPGTKLPLLSVTVPKNAPSVPIWPGSSELARHNRIEAKLILPMRCSFGTIVHSAGSEIN